MNAISKLAICTVFAAGLGFAPAAFAQGATGGEATAQTGGAADTGAAAGVGGGAAADTSAAAPAAGATMGEHEMTGTVTSITNTGKVSVKTGAGVLKLHFPPDSLADVKKGDSITVKMSFRKS